MPNIGAPELIIILVIALLILGPGKLPEVGASIGKSLREFRKASSDVQEATKIDISPTESATPAASAAPVVPVAAAVTQAAPVVPDADAVAAAKATLAAAEAAGVSTADAPAVTPSTSEPTAASH